MINIRKASLEDLLDEKDRIEKMLAHTSPDAVRKQLTSQLTKINKEIEKIRWWKSNSAGFADILHNEINKQAARRRQEIENEKKT